MGLSTHVLDTAAGRPAAGIAVRLDAQAGDGWTPVREAVTDADGRVSALADELRAGTYRLTFDTGAYFPDGFYPEAPVVFRVTAAGEHHHVPLLLSPFGYATYRGS